MLKRARNRNVAQKVTLSGKTRAKTEGNGPFAERWLR
jgi:hypothetical protein